MQAIPVEYMQTIATDLNPVTRVLDLGSQGFNFFSALGERVDVVNGKQIVGHVFG